MGGGGAERVALTLIRQFTERGHKIDLLLMTARGPLLPLVPKEVDVIDLGATRIRGAFWPILRYLVRTRPVALQVSMWPLTIAAIIASLLSRSNTRIVVSDHAALSKEYGGRGLWHRQFLKWSIRLMYPRADARVVVAANTAADLAHLSGLPERCFEVIYNPVDSSMEQRSAEVEQLWGGAGRRILNVGRLDPQKNQMLLLEAFARLPAECNAGLMIVGEGSLRDTLQRRAIELGIADRLVMPGFQLNPRPFYCSADLFVLSSEFEGYPLVLIEALYAGLPIVSTDCISGPAEILKDGEFWRLVPCGDAMALCRAMTEALSAPSSADRLKQRASELTAGTADRYLDLMIGEGAPCLESSALRSTTAT
jgi:glycosyltransferase involved in cell wall biosynthesis